MIPAPIRRVCSWWSTQSGADKYRLYTRLVLQAVLVGIVVLLIVSGTDTWTTAALVLAGVAGIAGIESHPDLSLRLNDDQRRIAWRFAIAVLAGLWVVSVVIARVDDEAAGRRATALGMFAFGVAAVAILPFLRRHWALACAMAVASVVLLRPPNPIATLVMLLAITVLLIWTSRASVWGLQILTELERNKAIEAELTVAQERLRFSRDLHDVVGRAFSAVAVKSELAATLARAGATERAAAEMDAVKALAVSSMDDTRALVRGYRGIDLGTEVAGARALLSSAGCELRVIGSPEVVPAQFHEAAAWVVREGTTNIVKHSEARQAVLTLTDSTLTLRNDGVTRAGPADGASSGIDGLRGRLGAVDADLDAQRLDSEFVLTATWGS